MAIALPPLPISPISCEPYPLCEIKAFIAHCAQKKDLSTLKIWIAETQLFLSFDSTTVSFDFEKLPREIEEFTLETLLFLLLRLAAENETIPLETLIARHVEGALFEFIRIRIMSYERLRLASRTSRIEDLGDWMSPILSLAAHLEAKESEHPFLQELNYYLCKMGYSFAVRKNKFLPKAPFDLTQDVFNAPLFFSSCLMGTLLSGDKSYAKALILKGAQLISLDEEINPLQILEKLLSAYSETQHDALSYFFCNLPESAIDACMEKLVPWRSSSLENGLMLVSRLAPPRLVECLLRIEPSLLHQTDRRRWTALMYAAQNPYPDVVKLLLESGIDPSALDEEGNTAMTIAASCDNTDMIGQLHKVAPYLISQPNKASDTPLLIATQNNAKHAMVALLQLGAPPNGCNREGTSPLLMAATSFFAHLTWTLLRRGANPNQANNAGITPLMIAALYGKNPVIIATLLAAGADICAKDHRGMTAMHYFFCRDLTPLSLAECTAEAAELTSLRIQEAIFNTLYEAGAKLDEEDGFRRRPLHIAESYKNWSGAQLLLSRGACDVLENPPLFPAIETESSPLLSQLLRNGASLTSSNKEGITPLGYSAKHFKFKALKYLVQANAPVDLRDTTASGETALIHLVSAALKSPPPIPKEVRKALYTLLEAKAAIDESDFFGHTALTRAIQAHHYDWIVFLLILGASPHAQDLYKRTPLMVAADCNNLLAAQKLLECGANPHAKDGKGKTAYDYATTEEMQDCLLSKASRT